MQIQKKHSQIDMPELLKENFTAWPYLGEEEIDAVSRVLRSGKVNYWTGDECNAFESEFGDFVSAQHAISLMNGTVALELALVAIGVGDGDEVIVTCRSFIASASAIVMRGATPVFADVDMTSQNVTAETIEPHISSRTKAIVVVHLAGWPCEMDDIMDLARSHNLKVVEDCAQALGATYKGRSVGSLGDVAAFSFCQDKIMTTGGEGGMLTTNDSEVWERAWAFKDHGKSHSTAMQPHAAPGFRWLHESIGTNWRMTEMQAALGRVALPKIPDWLSVRRRYATTLSQAFKDISGLRVTVPPQHIGHAYYKYYTFIIPEKLDSTIGRDTIIKKIDQTGVPCGSGTCGEIYLEKAFAKTIFRPPTHLPVAHALAETSLMLLVHPTLTDRNIKKTIKVVCETMKQFLK